MNDDKYKEIFTKSLHNPSKVKCIFCQKDYVPRKSDIEKHIAKEKHQNNYKSQAMMKAAMDNFKDKFSQLANADIIWSFYTVMKNLSFNLSDVVGKMFSKMFFDSQIAHEMIINQKKVKKIIEKVILGNILHVKYRHMRKICALSIDSSRDVSNKNEMIVVSSYYDKDSGKSGPEIWVSSEKLVYLQLFSLKYRNLRRSKGIFEKYFSHML